MKKDTKSTHFQVICLPCWQVVVKDNSMDYEQDSVKHTMINLSEVWNIKCFSALISLHLAIIIPASLTDIFQSDMSIPSIPFWHKVPVIKYPLESYIKPPIKKDHIRYIQVLSEEIGNKQTNRHIEWGILRRLHCFIRLKGRICYCNWAWQLLDYWIGLSVRCAWGPGTHSRQYSYNR